MEVPNRAVHGNLIRNLIVCAQRTFTNRSQPPFLSDPGKPGVRSLGPDVPPSVSETPCVDLTDVTLADEDTNSILTDNANRAIQGNVAMQ